MKQNQENVILSSEIAVGKIVIDSIRPLIACICMSGIAVVLWTLIPVIGLFLAIIPGLLSWLFLILAIAPIIIACNTHVKITDRGVYGKDGHKKFDLTYDQIKTVHFKPKGKIFRIIPKTPEKTPDSGKSIPSFYELDPLRNGEELCKKINSILEERNPDCKENTTNIEGEEQNS